MAQTPLIGRDAILKRWRSLYQNFKKKSVHPVWFIRVTGPAGVGRSALLNQIKKDLEKGGAFWEFSCLEGSLLPQLKQAVSAKNNDLFQAWSKRLSGKGPRKRAAIMIRDLQELEASEKIPLEDFFRRLSSLGQALVLVLEIKKGGSSVKIPSRQTKILEIGPLSAPAVAAWLKRGNKKTKPTSKGIKKFLKTTRGLPREMGHWEFYLKNHAADFLAEKNLKSWPKNRSDLMGKILPDLKPGELSLLQTWGLHPSWLNRSALAAATGLGVSQVGLALKNFFERGWIEASIFPGQRFLLKEMELAERAASLLSPESKQAMHRHLFSFLQKESRWPFRPTWLAYHASQGGLLTQAFCWNILAGEAYEGLGQWHEAQTYYSYALNLTRSDFQRAYLRGILGETYLQEKKYPLAWSSLKEATTLADKVPWPEFQQNFSLSLAQMLSHLGRYRQAETYFLQALQAIESRALVEERQKVRFQLGMCYVEQARYGEAEKIFFEVNQSYRDQDDVLERLGGQLGLLQVYIALGRVGEASALMNKIRQDLSELPLTLWEPLLQLLLAKLYTTQGRLDSALKILEGTAENFEAIGDLSGKVEVLLAMSAPMLEYGLIQEAQRIMELLGDWSELKESPALQHSIQLRRMAVSAFSGKWVEEDFALARESSLDMGRTEDWLLFWFHLALASRNFSDPKFFSYFIEKARDLAKTISEKLDPASAESFLHRPDIARIFRLAGEKGISPAAVVAASRETGAKGPAEAATLAPPVRGPAK